MAAFVSDFASAWVITNPNIIEKVTDIVFGMLRGCRIAAKTCPIGAFAIAAALAISTIADIVLADPSAISANVLRHVFGKLRSSLTALALIVDTTGTCRTNSAATELAVFSVALPLVI